MLGYSAACLSELVLTVLVLARSDHVVYKKLCECLICFVSIAAVCCYIHVCSGNGEISHEKRPTELERLSSREI